MFVFRESTKMICSASLLCRCTYGFEEPGDWREKDEKRCTTKGNAQQKPMCEKHLSGRSLMQDQSSSLNFRNKGPLTWKDRYAWRHLECPCCFQCSNNTNPFRTSPYLTWVHSTRWFLKISFRLLLWQSSLHELEMIKSQTHWRLKTRRLRDLAGQSKLFIAGSGGSRCCWIVAIDERWVPSGEQSGRTTP